MDKSWNSCTQEATGGKTVTAHLPHHHPQDRYLIWHSGRASLSLVRGIEMRQRYVATSIRRSCERGEKNLRENPSYHTARRRENIRMQHVERRTCRAGMRECCCWAPQWQSMISTSPKSPTVRSDDTDARSCCIRHPGSLDITDPSIPLITGITDGANLSTCAHPAQSGQVDATTHGCDPAVEMMHSVVVEDYMSLTHYVTTCSGFMFSSAGWTFI